MNQKKFSVYLNDDLISTGQTVTEAWDNAEESIGYIGDCQIFENKAFESKEIE